MLQLIFLIWMSIIWRVGVHGYNSLIKIGALDRSAFPTSREDIDTIDSVRHTADWGEEIGVDIEWSLIEDNSCFTVIKEAKQLASKTDLLIFADEFSACVGHGLKQHGISVPILFYKGRQSVQNLPKKKSSIFSGYLMCGFSHVTEDSQVTDTCQVDLDGPIQDEKQVTISKVETLIAVVKKLKWEHIFLFYETYSESEARVLTDSLSSVSINIIMYNLDDFTNTTDIHDLLTNRTIIERKTSHYIILTSADAANLILSVADNIDRIRDYKVASFSMTSQWLVILPDSNKSSIEGCVTDLDNVAVIIYPPYNYIFIHEMMKGLPLSIEEILKKVGTLNYTKSEDSTILRNETKQLFIKYFTNPLSCWQSDVYTLLWKPEGRKLNYVGFVNITGDVNLEHEIFPNLEFGLNKRRFTVSSLPWEPFVQDTVPYTGYCIDILQELSMALNFTYTFVDGPSDRQWGLRFPNDSWNGLIGQLQNKEVDLVVAPIIVSADRELAMDFLFPFFYDSLSVLIKKPDPSSTKWRTMIDPFRWEVLMCIGISLVGSSVILFLLEKWNPFYSREPYSNRYAGTHIFQDAFWYMYGAMLTQGGEHLPDSQTGRTMISTWWLFSIIMAATYSGNLIAFLTVTKDKAPFDTLKELVDQDEYKWGLMGGTKIQMEFQYSTDSTYKQIWNGITSDLSANPFYLSDNASVHFKMVEQGNYAFISDYSTLNIPLLTNCDLYVMKNKFMHLQYAFGLQNRSAFTEIMSSKMLSIYESGLLQIWHTRWWSSRLFCGGSLQTESKPIGLVDVQSSFYLIGVGLVLAAIALGIEHCFLKFFRWRKPHSITVVSHKNNEEHTSIEHSGENGTANGHVLHVLENGHASQDENDNFTSDGDLGISLEFMY